MERVRRGALTRFALAAILATTQTACGDDRTVLDVRTTLPAELRDAVEESFEAAHVDVDVRFSAGDSEASLTELRASDATAFDVWWGAPALALERAADEELLQPYRPAWLRQPGFGEPNAEGRWQVTLVTPFVIAFDRTTLPLAEAPRDWIDIFHHSWVQDVRTLDPMRSVEGSYFAGAMIVEALRRHDDLLAGFDWLRRLDHQVDVYAGETGELVRALETGDARLAIAPRAAVETARGDGAPWIHYRLPESGTPVLVRGVGITADTEVLDAARRFVDHVGTTAVATTSKLHTRWEPGHGDVDASRFPSDFELDQRWIAYPPAIDTLAAELDGWIGRWDREVRGR